jgi:hypothetical protein
MPYPWPVPESKTNFRREAATLAPPALFLAGVLELAARHDAGHRSLAAAAFAVLLTQVLPGALVWRLVRPHHGWLVEDLVMGLAVGAALAVPSQIIAVSLGQRWIAAAIPLVLALALVAMPATRAQIRSRSVSRLPWAWGAVVAVSSIGPLLDVLRAFTTPLRWRGWGTFYVDVPFHQAVTGELLNHFPPHYPQTGLEPFVGHWFTYVWTAQIATVSSTDLGTLLWRFSPALLMIVTPIGVAVAAMRLSGRAWTGPAAALFAFLLPDVVPWGASTMSSPLHTAMSPTQQLGAFLLAGLVILVTLRWRAEASRWSLPLFVLLLVITSGTKGSILPVIFAGMLAATVVAVVLRERALRTVAVDTFITAATMIILSKTMFRGLAGQISLDFGKNFAESLGQGIAGPAVTIAGATLFTNGALAVLTFLLGPMAALGLLSKRTTLRDPLTWLLFGGGAAGLGAMIMLTTAGSSQVYFYRSAESLIAIGAAWGATVLLDRAGSSRVLTIAGLVTGVVAFASAHFGLATDSSPGLRVALTALAILLVTIAIGAFAAAHATRTGLAGAVGVAAVAMLAAPSVAAAQAVVTWEKPPVAVHENPTARAINFGDVEALRWLRDNSDPDDVIATNRHCLDAAADRCDRRQFFIGAYAERRVLIEGWAYTNHGSKFLAEFGYARLPEATFWDPDLLALNDGFIAAPSKARADRLWNLGVRWIVVWPQAPHADDLTPYARRVHHGATVTIYRLSRR